MRNGVLPQEELVRSADDIGHLSGLKPGRRSWDNPAGPD
jgi:hypothetical protein